MLRRMLMVLILKLASDSNLSASAVVAFRSCSGGSSILSLMLKPAAVRGVSGSLSIARIAICLARSKLVSVGTSTVSARRPGSAVTMMPSWRTRCGARPSIGTSTAMGVPSSSSNKRLAIPLGVRIAGFQYPTTTTFQSNGSIVILYLHPQRCARHSPDRRVDRRCAPLATLCQRSPSP